MKKLLIDCTGIIVNYNKKIFYGTGILGISLQYLLYYHNNSQLCFHFRKNIYIFSEEASLKISSIILNQDPKAIKKILWLMIKDCFFYSKKQSQNSRYILLKTDYSGLQYQSYFNALKKYNIELISFVHDLIPFTDPQLIKLNTHLFQKKLNNILKYSSGIITNSNYTQNELKKYYPISTALITSFFGSKLTHTTINKSKKTINKPYFIILGTLDIRKNHVFLLNIWHEINKKLGDKAPELIIIGHLPKNNIFIKHQIQNSHNIKHIICDDETLANYLYHSQALLFPTLSEGFGLPLIEALGMKIPVIASDLEVFREIAGNVPEYLHPLDGLGWIKTIENYTHENSSLREAQLKRIENYSPPTWQKHFEQIDDFISKI